MPDTPLPQRLIWLVAAPVSFLHACYYSAPAFTYSNNNMWLDNALPVVNVAVLTSLYDTFVAWQTR